MLFLLSLAISSCAIEQSPIDYGKDACYSCKMNIVDRQHAAEIVTSKGKPYKYDAIECMMQDIKERENEFEVALYLITDYSEPGKLVDAQKATYLISEKLPSPMGANLTGFAKKEDAIKTQTEKDGNIYNWNELKELF
jgi:copper chaperone NosL